MAPKPKRQKIELVFDTKEREAFLTGFSKRKQARKKAARVIVEKQFKDEVTRIKKAKRERIKQRLEEVSSVRRANGMELAQFAANEAESEKILDLPQHVVTITSTEEMDLSKCDDTVYLGSNSQTDSVEVIDTLTIDKTNAESGKDEGGKNKSEIETKTNQRKSVSRVAELARRAQMLNKKRHRKPMESGRKSKSQKKFLKRKSKHKARSSH